MAKGYWNDKRGSNIASHGSKWIRHDKRLAIYIRDQMTCLWCRKKFKSRNQIVLDHLLPFSKGGDNHESNLVTACRSCNDRRSDRSVKEFAQFMGQRRGDSMDKILARIAEATSRMLSFDRDDAKKKIEESGQLCALF